MRENRFIRPLTDDEAKMTDDELIAWINEQNAKEEQRRATLKAEQKGIAEAIKETDSEALGHAAKLFFAGAGSEKADRETQAAYELLRKFFLIDYEL